MADEKKSFLLYADYINVVRKMPADKAGELFLTILAYVNDENPVVTDMIVDLVFEPIKQQLKRDLVKWSDTKITKSENGALGNLKRWNNDLYQQVITNVITIENAIAIAKHRKASHGDNSQQEKSQSVADVAVNVNDTVTVTVNDIIREGNLSIPPTAPVNNFDIGKGKEKGKTKEARMAVPKIPENVQEVEAYMYNKMKNRWDPGFCNLQANKFFDFYTSNGWKQSKGNKIVSWVAAANMWIYRDIEKQDSPEIKKAVPPVVNKVPSQTVAPPKVLSPEEMDKRNIDFIEAIFNEFRAGTVVEIGIPADIFTVLSDKSLLILSKEEMNKILADCENDKVKARKRAVSQHFKTLIDAGSETVFTNSN